MQGTRVLQVLLPIFFLVLYIPCRLIWRVKIRWTQKIALSFSFCLTILTIVCTIARMSGIHTGRSFRSVDSVWETYWQFVAANLALTMTSATAFRRFFVARGQDRQERSRSTDTWYERSRRFLHSAFTTGLWRSQRGANSSRENPKPNSLPQLSHHIPHGTMTGIRTFINSAGRTKARDSQIMASTVDEEYQDEWPLSTANRIERGITVQKDIESRSEGAC